MAFPQRVLLSGSSGLIGKALRQSLLARGSSVTRLVRGQLDSAEWPGFGQHSSDEVLVWDPATGRVDPSRLSGFDAVVHLAGESIGNGGGPLGFLGRWTPESKRAVYDSRVAPTRHLARALAAAKQPPRVLVCASGVGFYGADNAGGLLVEDSPRGRDFLSVMAADWEGACTDAHAAGIRVVNTRFGAVLSKDGGMIAKLVLPFSLGLGGNMGPGTQVVPWVELGDAVRAIEHALSTPSLSGPVNVVASADTTNAQLTAALAATLHRPAFLHMPEAAVRLVFGEMGEQLLLASQRVSSAKLEASGFAFKSRGIADGIAAALR